MLHELIDRDVPRCLYCRVKFDFNAMSISSSSHGSASHLTPSLRSYMMRYDREALYCVDCKEKFEILSNQSDEGEATYTGFIFTCKGFEVFYDYVQSTIDISDLKGEHHTAIPSFDPDFSDRDRLHEKLKTYLVFS